MPEAISSLSPQRAAPAAMLPAATPRIPDYELLRIIGRGSYGDVWLARGITGLYRAVKLVWRDRFADPQPYEREFNGLREFAVISIAESRQLALLHVGRNDAAGFFYYVMELADDVETGREIHPERYVPCTLSAIEQRLGRRPAREVVSLGVELSRALAGLHARGLVHRDVKPSNVIFVGGAPKLADIGLVTAATSAHTFVGTEGFVPPEGPGTPAADVFSLGKLLYETATGLDRHEYPRLPADLGALPDRKELLELNEILIRACDPDASHRYTDATALLDDLLLLQAGRSMRRLRAAERSLSRAIRIGAVLALVAAIAGSGAFVERRRAESENALRRQAEAERDDLARKSVYSAGLARAQRALELGDLGRARQHLQEIAVAQNGQSDLRGFEWHALWHEAQGDPAIVLREEGPAAERVRFSPDGKLIAVHTADKRVTLWDAATQKVLRTIEGIHRFAGFSADAQWLVGTDPSLALQRWRVTNGTPDHAAPGGTNRPVSPVGSDRLLCFTDAQASASSGHRLRLWDFVQRTNVADIAVEAQSDGTRWDFFRVIASPDGSLAALDLVSGRAHETRHKLLVYELATNRLLHTEIVSQRLATLAFSPDNRMLAAISGYVELQLFDLAKRQWRWRHPVGNSQSNVLTFSPDGTRLAAAGRDQVIRILDVTTGELRSELRGADGVIDDLAWHPDDAALISGTNTGDVRIWRDNLGTGRRVATGFWAPTYIGSAFLCVSADGTRVAVPRDEKTLEVLFSETLKTVRRLSGSLTPIGFSSDGRNLLASDGRGTVQRWSLDDTTPAIALKVFDGNSLTPLVAVSADGRWLAAGSTDGRIQLWDLPARRLVAEHAAHLDNIWTLAFSPDGETLVTTGRPGIKIWHVPSGELRHAWNTGRACYAAAFSSDGAWLALGYADGDIEVRDVRTQEFKHMRTLRTSSARVQTLTFSPDSARLVCGSPRGMLHVFATVDWRERLTFAVEPKAAVAAESNIAHLQFSANGSVLAALLADGRVRLWTK